MREFLRRARGYFAAFVAGLIAGFLTLLAILTGGIDLREEQRRERAEAEKHLTDLEAELADGRETRSMDAEEIRRKMLGGTLCILVVLAGIFGGCASARAAGNAGSASQPPARSVPYIPGDFETLRQYYLAAWDLSEKWRTLYLEAEESARKLRESNERLQSVIAEQQREIDSLRTRGPSFGLVGGATWSPGGPGVFVGGGFSW